MNTDVKSTKQLSAMEDYLNSVYKLIILVFPGACQCAGLVYTFEKIMGWLPSVSWMSLIIFDITCLIYLVIGFVFVKTGYKDGNLRKESLKWGKIYLLIIEIIQFNFILYMIPATDFWGFAFFFVVLVSFFHDWKLVAAVSAEIAGSLAVSWFINGDITLPAQNEYFMPNLLDRIIAVALSLPTLVFLAYITNRFLVNAKKDELERNNARVQNVLATAQLSEKMLEAGGALSVISDNEASTAEALSSTSETLMTNSDALREKADTSVANLNELTESGVLLSENVRRVSVTSDQVMRKTEENEDALNSLRDINKDVTKTMTETNAVAAQLSEAVKGIDATLALINDVAMQTNILSINASIEAARAGEAGRGFAVVAQEVGSLANSTQQSLLEIQEVMDRVKESVSAMTAYVGENNSKLYVQNDKFETVFENMQEIGALLRQSMQDIESMNQENERQTDIIKRTVDINADIAGSIESENESFRTISEMVESNARDSLDIKKQVAAINGMAEQIDELLK